MSVSPVEQFREAMRTAGIEPPDLIKTDGKLHRFSSDGRRGDDAGWYILHAGDIPAGAFGCWRSDIYETWRADIGRELTAEEIAANKRKISEAKRKQEEEKKKSQAKARARAAKIWDSAANAPSNHPYLATKGISAHGLRFDHDELVVPMYDSAGVLHNLQFIAADGAKNFLFGGRVTGCHHILGEPNGVLCTAEGYATAASIFEAARHAVAVGFNAANLPLVAKELRAKFSDLRFIICADDDARTPGNPGLKHAREAATAVGGYLAVPDFGKNRPEKASDFNDLHQCAGEEAVRACIERAVPVEARAGHSPYILAELPLEARLYLMQGQSGRHVMTGVSPEFAMTRMDEYPHPECEIYVEDERARTLLREIIVAHSKGLIERCSMIPFGAANVGRSLGMMVSQGRFPRPSCVFLDGDQAESPGCFLLPGGDAPEPIVFADLQKIGWGKVSDRTGRAYADVADACMQAMALTDHHDWIKSAATKLVLPGEILWQAMSAEWSTNCLDKLAAKQTIQSISDLLLARPTAISSPTVQLPLFERSLDVFDDQERRP